MGEATPEFVRAVSDETGVPAWVLTQGGVDTTEAVWDRARAAVDWATRTAPRPPTAAVEASSPPTRITAQEATEGDDWLSAWRSGRLTAFGMPAPPDRVPRSRRGMPWWSPQLD